MTLLGKIFTLLIFMMSVLFMAFAIMVFATHKNWKELVINEDPNAGPIGLKKQNQERENTIIGLRKELQVASNNLAGERAARRSALASLQEKLAQNEQALATKVKQYDDATADKAKLLETVKTQEDLNKDLNEKITTLRTDIRVVREDRDTQFAQVVALTDKVHDLEGAKLTLEEQAKELLAEVTRYKGERDLYNTLLTRNNIEIDTDVVPEVDGVVLAVAGSDFLEISIGSDDGLKPGHSLEVFRDRVYLGRVVVRKTAPNRAVGQVIKGTLRSEIKRGDRVADRVL